MHSFFYYYFTSWYELIQVGIADWFRCTSMGDSPINNFAWILWRHYILGNMISSMQWDSQSQANVDLKSKRTNRLTNHRIKDRKTGIKIQNKSGFELMFWLREKQKTSRFSITLTVSMRIEAISIPKKEFVCKGMVNDCKKRRSKLIDASNRLEFSSQ